MQILKRIGIGLLAVVVLLLVISLFLPSKVKVERSLVMNASPEVIFTQINTLKNWEKWSPWHRIDPAMALSYAGPAEGQGAKYSWQSAHENVGNGGLEITASVPYQQVITEMDFMDNGKAKGEYTFEAVEGGTKVTWSMESDMGMSPVGKYFGLMMDRMMGKDFEAGLTNIKDIVENAPPEAAAPVEKEATYNVEASTVTAQPILTIRAKCTAKDLAQKLGEIYGEIQKDISKNGLTAAGQPFAIYHKWSAVEVEVEAGLPVNKKGKDNGNIKAGEIKAGNVVMLKYYGPYEGTEKAHAAIDSYLKANNKKLTGSPWEVYVTDPATETDPSKVLTEIYYPVE